ncbi:MAG: rod shape-determining protein RodA [Venatoribacter sp.]
MPSQDFSRSLSQGGQSSFGRSKALFARIHLDLPLLLLLLCLACVGLFVLYSGSGRDPDMLSRQLIHFAIGFTALFVTAQIPPRFYSIATPWVYLASLLGLIGVLLFGVGAKGAQRWLALPGLPRFQPAEIMKIALPLMMAWYMSTQPLPPRLKSILVSILIIVVPTLLILKQPDLGTALLVASVGFFVIFFSGMSWRLIISMITLVSALAPIMWFYVMHDYQKQRVLTFLNPESDPLGSGWNIIQSKIAIGSGGIQGKGWLLGTQSHLEFLPESHTDFIIAVLAEELGFVGVLLLLTLYALIIMRCLYLANLGKTLFSRLVAGSLAMMFFIYIFVNMGMVSGILPVVGVPLPLISYGGTSVISLLTAFGILMSMSTHK